MELNIRKSGHAFTREAYHYDRSPFYAIVASAYATRHSRPAKAYKVEVRGVARIFQRGGSHCVESKKKGLVSYGQDIVMAFSPSVVGSLVNKGLQKGGITGTPEPPLPTPLVDVKPKLTLQVSSMFNTHFAH